MPGFVTHYLFGIQTLRFLKTESAANEPLFQSISRHKTVFQFGLQGPDFFFFHLPSQLRKEKPGSIVHTQKTGAFLRCLIDAPRLFTRPADRETAQAYAAGFLGHYMLDTQIHPFVYYESGYTDTSCRVDYGSHVALETDMDTCLLMRYAHCLPSALRYGRTIAFDAHTRAVVAQILHHAFTALFPELGLTRRTLAAAIFAMQKETLLLYNPHRFKRPLAEALERRLLGRLSLSTVVPCDELRYCDDPLNLTHRRWHNPWQPENVSHASVPQLMKKASGRYRKALTQLARIYRATDDAAIKAGADALIPALGNRCYHSGLELEKS